MLNHLNCTVGCQKVAAELQQHLSAARMDQDPIALGTTKWPHIVPGNPGHPCSTYGLPGLRGVPWRTGMWRRLPALALFSCPYHTTKPSAGTSCLPCSPLSRRLDLHWELRTVPASAPSEGAWAPLGHSEGQGMFPVDRLDETNCLLCRNGGKELNHVDMSHDALLCVWVILFSSHNQRDQGMHGHSSWGTELLKLLNENSTSVRTRKEKAHCFCLGLPCAGAEGCRPSGCHPAGPSSNSFTRKSRKRNKKKTIRGFHGYWTVYFLLTIITNSAIQTSNRCQK